MSDDYRGGYLGQAGYRETRRGGLREDITRPGLQSFALLVINALVVFGVYLAMRHFFPDEDAWQVIADFGLLSLLALAVARSGLVVIKDDDDEDDNKSIKKDDNRILKLLAAAAIATAAVWFVLTQAGPWTAYHMYHDPSGVAIVAILFGIYRAYPSTVYHFTQELTNGLWNSDPHYAAKQREIEWEREKFALEQKERLEHGYELSEIEEELRRAINERERALKEAEHIKKYPPVKFVHIGAGQDDAHRVPGIDDTEAFTRFVIDVLERGRSLRRAAWFPVEDAVKAHGWTVKKEQWKQYRDFVYRKGWLDNEKPALTADAALAELGLTREGYKWEEAESEQ